jgi:Family of unknown function (DUF6328)
VSATKGGSKQGTRDKDTRESPKERSERRWNEMLQELRVAQTGVQILTGFLLTLPFSQRFDELAPSAKVAYLITVCSSILAAGLIIAPVSYHRVLFGKQEKDWLIRAGNNSARAGLALLGVTMCGVIFLVFDLIVSRSAAYIGSGATFVVLLVLWLVVPMVGGHADPETDA